MKLLIYILPFLTFSQMVQDNCILTLTDTLNIETLDIKCYDLFIDSYVLIECDSLKGSGRVLHGRYVESDTTGLILVNGYKQYTPPIYTKTLPKIRVIKYISDSLYISHLVLLE